MACPRCRRRARQAHLAEGQALFAGRPAGALRAITIPAIEIPHLGAAAEVVERLKRDLRSLLRRWRISRSKARLARFFGMLDFEPAEGGGWQIVARLVIDLAGANEVPLADLLARKWPTARLRPAAQIEAELADLWPRLSGEIELLNWLNDHRNMRVLRLHCRPARAQRPTPRDGRGGWAAPMPVAF